MRSKVTKGMLLLILLLVLAIAGAAALLLLLLTFCLMITFLFLNGDWLRIFSMSTLLLLLLLLLFAVAGLPMYDDDCDGFRPARVGVIGVRDDMAAVVIGPAFRD